MKLRYLVAALTLGILPVTAARAVNVSISVAPPELVAYEQPPCPVEGYLWTPGYWAYDDDAADYYWVDGVWVAPPRVGYLWTPGYWGFGDGFYAFHTGYWGPTVGFYGGINYGYGYGGYGYYGGRWDGRIFRYNTAVTRVNNTVIHNTYEDRNAIHDRTAARTSFNGRGGIDAKPDANERKAMSANHIKPTTGQREAFQKAQIAHHPEGATANNRNGGNELQDRHVTPNGKTTDVQHNTTGRTRGGGNRDAVTRTRGGTRSSGGNRTAVTRTRGGGGNRTANVSRGGGASRGASRGGGAPRATGASGNAKKKR